MAKATPAKAAPAKEAPAAEAQKAIEIQPIDQRGMLVPIVGVSPLIVHKFSEKSKRKMLDAMQGKKAAKDIRNPKAEYEEAMYRLEKGGYGFPSVAFKAATVGGARFYSSITMTALRQYIFFGGDRGTEGEMLVKIEGKPVMREDTVRLTGKSTDLRYRPEFFPWKATLHVLYVASMITQGSVVSLINAGGIGVGVGEWRPERNGDFGRFQIDTTKEIKEF